MKRRTLMISAAAVLGLCLTGCSSTPRHPASMGMVSPQPKVLSLAAGDSLGRAVYVNDMILAAAQIERDSAFTNVDEGAASRLNPDF